MFMHCTCCSLDFGWINPYVERCKQLLEFYGAFIGQWTIYITVSSMNPETCDRSLKARTVIILSKRVTTMSGVTEGQMVGSILVKKTGKTCEGWTGLNPWAIA